jgi:hypothetical protein
MDTNYVSTDTKSATFDAELASVDPDPAPMVPTFTPS